MQGHFRIVRFGVQIFCLHPWSRKIVVQVVGDQCKCECCRTMAMTRTAGESSKYDLRRGVE